MRRLASGFLGTLAIFLIANTAISAGLAGIRILVEAPGHPAECPHMVMCVRE